MKLILIVWLNVSAWARLNGIWPRGKNSDFLLFFHTLTLFSRLFPGLKNCWENFKTFSRIQDCMNPGILSNRSPFPPGRKRYGVSGNLSTTRRQPPSLTSPPFELGAAGDIWLNRKRIAAQKLQDTCRIICHLNYYL